jgi:hypothetical protein
MKRVITLNYKNNDPQYDVLLFTAYQYVLRYNEIDDNMVFIIREEIEDDRTMYFLGDILCQIFNTEYSIRQYSLPDTVPENLWQIGLYDILFAFIDYVRKETDEKHYKEYLRKKFAEQKIDVKETLPAIHLLKNNKYTLTPVESVKYGYDRITVQAKYKLNGKTKEQKTARNKKRRAVYRNFKWENLYESCALYRDFVRGYIYTTEDVYILARGMCSAEKGRNKFLEIIKSQLERDTYSNNKG